MRYGDMIAVHPGRVLIPSKELEAVGIFPNSQAWGGWLPNWDDENRRNQREDEPQNLLISPIHPASWPILVRVRMRLRKGAAALERAARVLKDSGLNLLSYDCTVSGYHHLTWTIVGEYEALRLKSGAGKTMLEELQLPDNQRTLRSKPIFEFTHERLAPAMLQYCDSLERQLSLKGTKGRGQFLHPAFLAKARPFGGRVYDSAYLPAGVRSIGERHRLEQVSCSWIQGLAFFWLYGRGLSHPLEFRVEEGRTLVPHPVIDDRLGTRLVQWFGERGKKAMAALAMFDTSDHYIRVLLSQADRDRRTTRIVVRYHHSLTDKHPTTRGFLRNLLADVRELDLDPVHLSNATTHRSTFEERNDILIVAETPKPLPPEALDRLKTSLERGGRDSDGFDRQIVSLAPVEQAQLFLSTRFDWKPWDRNRNRILDEAGALGFRAVVADGRLKVRAGRGGLTKDLTTEVRNTINESRAVLMLVPALDPFDVRWLCFEFGVALANETPVAVCIEKGNQGFDIYGGLKVGKGWRKFPFVARGSRETLMVAVRKALRQLARDVFDD